MGEFKHYPVMLHECLDALNLKEDGIYLDCTVGGAGHSVEIAKRLTTGKLLCLDKDMEAIRASKERLKSFKNVMFFHCDFKEFQKAIEFYKLEKFDGILIDLGVSSHQIDSKERGFSYMQNARLDMRMDKEQDLSAFEVVNEYSQKELEKIFFDYGQEPFSKRIAENIVLAREDKPIETTFELVDIIDRSVPKKVRYKKGHSAKKVFQALRIEVNSELINLYETLIDLTESLNSKGRLVVLTFHSLEDKIVKDAFKFLSTDCICPPNFPVCVCGHKREANLVNKKPILASEKEQAENSRSHSAKLRILEKI